MTRTSLIDEKSISKQGLKSNDYLILTGIENATNERNSSNISREHRALLFQFLFPYRYRRVQKEDGAGKGKSKVRGGPTGC